jgi:hypothetical protein
MNIRKTFIALISVSLISAPAATRSQAVRGQKER